MGMGDQLEGSLNDELINKRQRDNWIRPSQERELNYRIWGYIFRVALAGFTGRGRQGRQEERSYMCTHTACK